MRNQLLFVVLLTLATGTAFAAPTLDAGGKCRDNGKFVAAQLCAVTVTVGKCRDIKTKKFAKCATPGTEPLPTK